MMKSKFEEKKIFDDYYVYSNSHKMDNVKIILFALTMIIITVSVYFA